MARNCCFRLKTNVYWAAVGMLLAIGPVSGVLGQTVPGDAMPLLDSLIAGGQVWRLGNVLYVKPDDGSSTGVVTLPRLAASLKSTGWLGHVGDESLTFKIEQDHWGLSWNSRPANADTIAVEFDSPPWLLKEITPISASGDGSVFLPACRAITSGEKVRFEPQTFKNTVGYWTGKQDSATWEFVVERPGTFNMAILQGCGANQGGSTASLSLIHEVETPSVKIDFEVQETGHFQNFQWRPLGPVELRHAGRYSLKIEPLAIKKAALMDVRAVHLVRLPDNQR